jgi:hypothetical protein
MAEVKNTFMGSKMNKDVDSRIVPNNEYRHATNISVSRSEDSDVGALENIKGNEILKILDGDRFYNFGYECIGFCKDPANDNVYLFITNFVDSSNIAFSGSLYLGTEFTHVPLSNVPGCQILKVNLKTAESQILVSGNFLNFSKTNRVEAVLIEDQLFFTDNRNQPRKINVSDNTQSYQNEDDVSLAKYYPYQPIELYTRDVADPVTTMLNKTNKLLTYSITAISDSAGGGQSGLTNPGSGTNMQLPLRYKEEPNGKQLFYDSYLGANKAKFLTSKDVVGLPKNNSVTIVGTVSNYLYAGMNYKVVTLNGENSELVKIFDAVNAVSTGTNATGVKFYFHYENPDYSNSFAGDADFLKKKFVRFSYRFKFTDNEYSLIAPFTQACFIPEQFGHFTDYDDARTKNSGHVGFFQNLVQEISLFIKLPTTTTQLENNFKISDLEILYKEDKATNIHVVDSLTVENIISNFPNNDYIEYKYIGNNPIKVLPEQENTRVYDKVPIKALTLASVGNRVVFGNYVDRQSFPKSIPYRVNSGLKSPYNETSKTGLASREYPLHSLKQNRTYQVGFVLADRYGRQSEVILSSYDTGVITDEGLQFGASSLYVPYTPEVAMGIQLWFGNSLKIYLDDKIEPGDANSKSKGLYDPVYNPLGWYSYKVVVKQQEQDYYNIYLSGINSLTPKTISTEGTPEIQYLYQANENKVQIELSGDNINKIPRSLINVGPRDSKFAGSDVALFPRVNPKNYKDNLMAFPGDEQPFKADTVSTIAAFNDYNLETSNLWDFYNDGIPLTSTASLPVATITSSNSFRMGPEGYEDQQGDPGGGYVNARFQTLGVYETEPVKSEIDIYYETSTSGLISELNAAQDIIDEVGGFQDTTGNDTSQGESLEYLQNESMVAGSNVTLPFALTNTSGQVITDPHTVTLDSVVTSTGVDISSKFILSGTSGSYVIQTTTEDFVFLTNNPTYTFNFTATITSSGVTTPLSFDGELINSKPYFNNPNIEPTSMTNPTILWFPGENGNPNPNGDGSQNNPINCYVTGTTGVPAVGVYGTVGTSPNNDFALLKYIGTPVNNYYPPIASDGARTGDENYFYNGARQADLATGSVYNVNGAELYWKAEITNVPGADGNITRFASSNHSSMFRLYTLMPHSIIVLNNQTINNFINNGQITTNTAYRIKITMSDCDPNQIGIISSINGSEFDYLSTYVKFI